MVRFVHFISFFWFVGRAEIAVIYGNCYLSSFILYDMIARVPFMGGDGYYLGYLTCFNNFFMVEICFISIFIAFYGIYP